MIGKEGNSNGDRKDFLQQEKMVEKRDEKEVVCLQASTLKVNVKCINTAAGCNMRRE
jgi:hypothetical protein